MHEFDVISAKELWQYFVHFQQRQVSSDADVRTAAKLLSCELRSILYSRQNRIVGKGGGVGKKKRE